MNYLKLKSTDLMFVKTCLTLDEDIEKAWKPLGIRQFVEPWIKCFLDKYQ